ncbi:MAG: class I SAM-dependent methyltransferase [Planctomycetes bacterium]|nr:class I SAM-dependent methyltransferase [Planctomycetota bacterium]MBI3835162.1 class I SAM-dependent methyltransferase [Planctomycetota bacterium]
MQDTINWNERYSTKQTPWDSGKHSIELERVLNERLVKPCRMLEIGCGTGTNAIFLAKRGFTVTAVDVSPLAVEQAKTKGKQAGANIDFRVADVMSGTDLGPPFDFVFDRGVYHHVRTFDLWGFLSALSRLTKSGGQYLTLAGNANDRHTPPEGGPPVVRTVEICSELTSLFDLAQLREFTFDGVVVDGKAITPLGWSALFRRR